MKRLALIDGDIITYSVGFAAEGEPLSHALHSVKQMLKRIQEDSKCDESQVFLTGPNNYRIEAATCQTYKGNRKQPKPEHYLAIREYLEQKKEAIVTDGIEADDALGITQASPPEGYDTVICSIDKDLDMIKGEHYRWTGKRQGTYHVSDREAEEFFYTQLLTGDSGDNIPSMFKYCGAKATKKVKQTILDADSTEDMYQAVLDAYNAGVVKGGKNWDMEPEEFIKEIGSLLWIQREAGEIWQPPK